MKKNTMLFFVLFSTLIYNLISSKEGLDEITHSHHPGDNPIQHSHAPQVLEPDIETDNTTLLTQISGALTEHEKLKNINKETPVILNINSKSMDELENYAPTLGTENPTPAPAPQKNFSDINPFGLKEQSKQSEDLRNYTNVVHSHAEPPAEQAIDAEPQLIKMNSAESSNTPASSNAAASSNAVYDCSKIDHRACRNLNL